MCFKKQKCMCAGVITKTQLKIIFPFFVNLRRNILLIRLISPKRLFHHFHVERKQYCISANIVAMLNIFSVTRNPVPLFINLNLQNNILNSIEQLHSFIKKICLLKDFSLKINPYTSQKR